MCTAGGGGFSPTVVHVKEELECADECSASEAAAAGLYLEHEVKDELVLGPEQMQSQDIAYAMQKPVNEMETGTAKLDLSLAADTEADLSEDSPCSNKSFIEQVALRAYYVKLKRIVIEEVSHACTTCHNMFLQESNLITHMCTCNKEETSYQFVIGENVFKVGNKKMIKPIEIHPRQQTHTCTLCKKQFITGYYLSQHKQVHTVFEQCSCCVCMTQFRWYSNLTTHKRYSCNLCQKQFPYLSSLTSHKIIHSAEKKYSCDTCKKQFKYSSTLVQHLIIHTGEKPYPCNICKKRFTDRSSSARHKRIHTGDKPYSCDTCKKKFTDRYSLARHKVIHTGQKPYSCDVCKKQFGHSFSLAQHKIIHTRDQSYSHKVCKKQFTQKSGLTNHKRIHTVEKPYSCL